jgi:hypothetical protein
MRVMTCVLAILAAASTAALAKDLKQDKKPTAPAVAATQMNDAEMDKVTAGGTVGISNDKIDLSLTTGAHAYGSITTPHGLVNIPGGP